MVENKKLSDYVHYFPNMLDEEYCDYAVSEMEKCDKFVSIVYGKEEYHYDFYGIGLNEESDLKHLYFPIIDSLLSAKDKYLEKIDMYHPGPKKNIDGIEYFVEFGDRVRIQHHRTGGLTPKHFDRPISQNPEKTYGASPDSGWKVPARPYERFSEVLKINLTAILYVNDDYKGGQFYIMDEEYSTEKGSVIIFPSGFMWPHGVKKVTEGERWSISMFIR